MLNAAGRKAALVEVNDNNDIDREVTIFKPDTVIIEALWVVPSKFDVLRRLHPHIHWIIRVHSDFPFLAHEGIAMEWLFRYLDNPQVSVAFNKEQTACEFQRLTRRSVLFLPNYYPATTYDRIPSQPGTVNIGCFGALRPLKNQLVQALAALQYADCKKKKLFFHINGTRCEGGGEEVRKNLRALFVNTRHHLLEHIWLPRPEFINVLRRMDIELAVSLSETFCIVAADALACNVPLICSDQIPWANVGIAPTTDANRIAEKMDSTFLNRRLNWHGLQEYAEKSRKIWLSLYC